VVAAGRGSRLGGGLLKQYRLLGGVPMVLRSLRPFTAHPEVLQVVLVLPPADAAAPPAFLRELIGERLRLVAGGAERADSVAAGLAALDPRCTVVLVHDAARPFVERGVIDAVIGHARAGEGAVAAIAAAGKTGQVKVAAYDADPSQVQGLRNGAYVAQRTLATKSSGSSASRPVSPCRIASHTPPAPRKAIAGVSRAAASMMVSPQPSLSDGTSASHPCDNNSCLRRSLT